MERTRAISTSFYKAYKYISHGLLALLLLLQIGRVALAFGGNIIGVVLALTMSIGLLVWWYPSILKDMNRLKDISYDSENLYIIENGIEEQIPYLEVRDVEITSMNGIYRFNFFNKELHEGWVSCKTSMWYPFNFKKVDRELNRVRALIRKAHAEYREQIGNENRLASHT